MIPIAEPDTQSQRITVPRRVLMLGATGTIGRATVQALLQRGHEVVCVVRPQAHPDGRGPVPDRARWLRGAELREADVLQPESLRREGLRGERFDALVSCLASRTGVAADAWAIDHRAHVQALKAARQAGVTQVVLLSAICVQKPKLEFQRAKLAFEQVLTSSSVAHAIVRPTAFFKSLSGQVQRLQRGKPFLLFGDGRLTACKPISDTDLAAYLADCLDNPSRLGRILPIGGPGPAITPRQQGEALFKLLGQAPRFKQVPLGLLDTVITALAAAAKVLPFLPALAAKAELARIGRYYATESMLVWDPATGRYDADATPSTGSQTLFDHYAELLNGTAAAERGEHAVF